MYNYDFKANDEKIILEKKDCIIDINDNSSNVSLVITNKNLLLFQDISKNSPLSSRAVYMREEYYLNLSISLSNLNYEIENNNTIINYNNNEIVIYDFNIKEYLNN